MARGSGGCRVGVSAEVVVQALCHARGVRYGKRRRDDMREFPVPLYPLRLLVIEYEPLLLRRFHSTRNTTSNPLERLSPRETQTPLCQVRGKQSSAPNAR